MEKMLLDLASKESLFAVMFVALFLYQIFDSRKREEKLMSFIGSMSTQYEALAKQYEKIADDVDEIRKDMKEIFKR